MTPIAPASWNAALNGGRKIISSSRCVTWGSVRAVPSRPPFGMLYTAKCFGVETTRIAWIARTWILPSSDVRYGSSL